MKITLKCDLNNTQVFCCARLNANTQAVTTSTVNKVVPYNTDVVFDVPLEDTDKGVTFRRMGYDNTKPDPSDYNFVDGFVANWTINSVTPATSNILYANGDVVILLYNNSSNPGTQS